MNYEIERRFIVRLQSRAALEGAEVHRFEQAYLSTGEPGVRVRRAGDVYTLTVKAGRGLVREEVEFPVPAAAGAALMQIGGARRLNKTRHRLGRWEIDIFEGALAGLILAEVELAAADEPQPTPPEGVLLVREVTEDSRYVNQVLAGLDEAAAARLVEESLAAG